MTTKNKTSLYLSALILCLTLSCNEWTENDPLKYNVDQPGKHDTEAWNEYLQALKDYKASGHFISYALFDNAPAKPSSEKDFMRCLPDSLDIVSLTNASNLSLYDLEDLAVLRDKGTKAIYRIDYAGSGDEMANTAALSKYIDDAISMVNNHKLDGFSFTGAPIPGDENASEASSLIVSKLSAVAGTGKNKILVFEGDPTFVAAADRGKINYFVLNTENFDNISDIKRHVQYATGFLAIPNSSILLSAGAESTIFDENNRELAAIPEITSRVMPLGPLGGFAVYGADKDYFGSDTNYKLTRSAIQMLNPAN